jgi:hypothetical protein
MQRSCRALFLRADYNIMNLILFLIRRGTMMHDLVISLTDVAILPDHQIVPSPIISEKF